MSSVLVREAAGAGQLVLAGAPLGNPADASPRLRAELAAADVVAAEDTRRLARLVRDLDVRPGERRSRLAELAGEPRTQVFFEAPHRLAAALADLAAAFGADRPAAVCRELTKTYEEVRRAPLAELAAWAAGAVRGEVTLVVAGAPAAPPTTDTATLAAEVAEREAAGEPRREAIAAVARALGVPKRLVFDAVVAGKRTSKPG